MPDPTPESYGVDTRTRRSWNFRGRAVLILVLIPLLVASWQLHKTMPPAHLWSKFDGRRPFIYWNTVHVQRNNNGNPYESNDHPIIRMNVDTGAITTATKADLVWRDGVNSRGERVMIGSPPSLTQSIEKTSSGISNPSRDRRCAYFKNMETGAT